MAPSIAQTEEAGRSSVPGHLSKHGNPALFVTPQHTLEVRDTPIPEPLPHEALIHVRATGVCGSDIHFWHRGSIGPLVFSTDSILGHEASGVVLATGSAVTHLTPGDRVAIEPGIPCRNCFLCDAGKYNLCESVRFAGVCPFPGTARRFFTHDARYCHKIPDSMTFAQGALLEPLSVVLHGIEQCNTLRIGRPALICGAGPIGLMALASAKASGAWPLCITDIDAQRLAFASEVVPGVKTYRIDPGKQPLQCAEEIRALYGCATRDMDASVPSPNEYLAPTTVLECTGVESSIVASIFSCRRSGTVVVIGVGKSVINNLPFMHLSLAEIDLKFSNRYSDTWPAGINALTEKRILDLDRLVTHTVPLERATEGMELCADAGTLSVKVQIVDDLEIGA